MEWVETTGKTVEEAKEAALDRLGVDEQDAEFEVIEEPRSGLFGRTRGVGRVRARVAPRAPRPKPERRKRTKSGGRSGSGGGSAAESETATDEETASGGGSRPRNRNRGGRGGQGGRNGEGRSDDRSENRSESKDAADAGGPGGGRDRGGRSSAPQKEREVMDEAAQCEAVTTFLDGLGQAFGLEVTSSATIDGDVLRASIEGSEVGLFIGPGLGTLEAIQEIARNVLQRHADGREHAKVVLDVSGVRELRRTKLAAFVTDAAQQVKDDGIEVTFEVMSSPDRKVVHDTVAEIDGVASNSIGEDPRRRVVLKPA